MAKKVEKKEEDRTLDELLDAIPEAKNEEVEETVEEPVEEQEYLFEEAREEYQDEQEEQEELGAADLELTEEESASLDASRNYGEPDEEAEEEVVEESVDEAVDNEPVVEEAAAEEQADEEAAEEADVEEQADEEAADAEVVDEKPAKKHHYVRNGLLILGAAASLATAFVGGVHAQKFIWDNHVIELDKDEKAFDTVINTLGEAGITLDDITAGNIFSYSADVNGIPTLVYYSHKNKQSYYVALSETGFAEYQQHSDGKIVLKSDLFADRESKATVVELYNKLLQNAIAAVKAENAQLKADLNKANFDLAAAQRANNELKKLIAELNKKFEGEEAAENTDVKALEKHIDELTAENEANKQALKDINAKVEEALNKELTGSDDKDVAKTNVDALIAAVKAKDQEIQNKDAEIAALKAKLNSNEEIVNAVTSSDGKEVVAVLYTLLEQNEHTNEGEQYEVGQE